MHAFRIAALSLVALTMASAVVFWWAGFAPFPTDPVLLASYQDAGFCSVHEENWAKCEPGLDNPYPQGSAGSYRLFPVVGKKDYGQYNQWGVEGSNGCWDAGCRDIWHEDGVGQLRWKIYYDTEVPHFGLGHPKWVVTIQSRQGRPLDGSYAETAYTTYAACMYRKPSDTNTEWYKCEMLEAADPWHVGSIRNP